MDESRYRSVAKGLQGFPVEHGVVSKRGLRHPEAQLDTGVSVIVHSAQLPENQFHQSPLGSSTRQRHILPRN